MDNFLEQKENNAYVRGTLNSISLSKENAPAYDNGRVPAQRVIRGGLDIRVESEGQELIIPFGVYTREKKANGEANPAFAGLETVMSKYKSIADTGDVNTATRVEIGLGRIQANTFASRDGEDIISYPEVNSVFFNTVHDAALKDEARFDLFVYVADIAEELDENGVTTGRLELQTVVPKWGGKVDIIPFFVEGKESVNHIRGNWKAGDTVRIAGDIRFLVKTEKVKVEGMGFGEPVYEERTTTLRELVVRSGSVRGLSQDEAFDPQLIDAALAERAEWLTELKQKKKDASNTTTTAPSGFSAPSNDSVDDFIGNLGF